MANVTDRSQSNTSFGECDDCVTESLCGDHGNRSDIGAGQSWALVSTAVFTKGAVKVNVRKTQKLRTTKDPKSIIKQHIKEDPRRTFKERFTSK